MPEPFQSRLRERHRTQSMKRIARASNYFVACQGFHRNWIYLFYCHSFCSGITAFNYQLRRRYRYLQAAEGVSLQEVYRTLEIQGRQNMFMQTQPKAKCEDHIKVFARPKYFKISFGLFLVVGSGSSSRRTHNEQLFALASRGLALSITFKAYSQISIR
jgi:hypothetical protein